MKDAKYYARQVASLWNPPVSVSRFLAGDDGCREAARAEAELAIRDAAVEAQEVAWLPTPPRDYAPGDTRRDAARATLCAARADAEGARQAAAWALALAESQTEAYWDGRYADGPDGIPSIGKAHEAALGRLG